MFIDAKLAMSGQSIRQNSGKFDRPLGGVLADSSRNIELCFVEDFDNSFNLREFYNLD